MLLGALLSNAVGAPPSPPQPEQGSRLIRNLDAGKPQIVVVFGTSLTAGGAWVGLMKDYLVGKYPGLVTVYNEAGSGHSSVWGLANIHNVTRHAPDAALIEFAMNDAYYPEREGYTEGVSIDTSRANLRRIVDSIKASNPACEIFLQTMDVCLGIHRIRRPLLESYYDGYRKEAAAGKFTLIDHMPKWKALVDWDTASYVAWLPDSIHPGAEASAAITLPGVLSAFTGAQVALDTGLSALYAHGTDIEIKAVATSPASRVDFYQGKTLIGSDSTYPYSCVWKGAPVGRYLIMARLVQGNTAVAVSQGIPIKVAVASALNHVTVGRTAKTGGKGRQGRAIAYGGDGKPYLLDGRKPVFK